MNDGYRATRKKISAENATYPINLHTRCRDVVALSRTVAMAIAMAMTATAADLASPERPTQLA